MQIVWFKRDLRTVDHRALARAAQVGSVLPLYVVEPELWQQPDAAQRQWAFVAETLHELRAALGQLGQPLILRTGRVIDVLADLQNQVPIDALWSHEETGNTWTFARDIEVAQWCRAQGVPWVQLQNHGVWRKLRTRDGWAERWDRLMAEPLASPPPLAPISVELGHIPTGRELKLSADTCPNRQTGGRDHGLRHLRSFLTTRGETYQRAMSSPADGATACSRVSPYLAWGALSIREVHQETQAQRRRLAPQSSSWQKSLRSFSGRLHWHCHFIQKLEDEPRIEFENLHRLYDNLRPKRPDAQLLGAWERGETGYPFLDACMRSLRATGWLNFRMRAMVMATAAYHLWLDWRAPGLHLARQFTDYEPGIHWSQVQMQSGTTGINTVRIYNPVKQGFDQDPKGIFIRKWVPELAHLSDEMLHEPWKASEPGDHYPPPVFDHMAAARFAREQIWGVRKSSEFRSQAQAIATKHASRKSPQRKGKPRAAQAPKNQLSLPFDDL